MTMLTDREMLLLMFSEWLDADMQVLREPDEGDERTHMDFARSFLAHAEANGYQLAAPITDAQVDAAQFIVYDEYREGDRDVIRAALEAARGAS